MSELAEAGENPKISFSGVLDPYPSKKSNTGQSERSDFFSCFRDEFSHSLGRFQNLTFGHDLSGKTGHS